MKINWINYISTLDNSNQEYTAERDIYTSFLS